MKYDWKQLQEDAEKGAPFPTKASLAGFLGVPRSTVKDALIRGDLDSSLISEREDADQISFKETGPNEAILKYRAAEPLSPEEALVVAGIDPEEWAIVDQKVNMWQMGRKAKEVDLRWVNGKPEGFVFDTGEINKTYLYKVEVSLTRKKRVPVKIELRPLQLDFIPAGKPKTEEFFCNKTETVLFIGDPHFGFRSSDGGRLQPIHDRRFISAILKIAEETRPDNVVWAGDMTDLGDLSSFDGEPHYANNLQVTGLELAWVLARFNEFTQNQVAIEGNHDARLGKAIKKYMTSLYGLKPVHELVGDPLLSLPRFLGLDHLGVKWIGDYPDGSVWIGDAKFFHGTISRKGSGRTVSSLIDSATVNQFFGHCHRFELAAKWIGDADRRIFMGSPGCACRRLYTPGGKTTSNWALGAFFLTFFAGELQSVEHISGDEFSSVAFFRGQRYAADYRDQLIAAIPEEFSFRL